MTTAVTTTMIVIYEAYVFLAFQRRYPSALKCVRLNDRMVLFLVNVVNLLIKILKVQSLKFRKGRKSRDFRGTLTKDAGADTDVQRGKTLQN